MQRYILDNKTEYFYKTDLHHIKNVMRMKTGDEVIVCLNNQCYLSKLTINDEVLYEKISEIKNHFTTDITLIQGLIKGTKIETTIKYATIFGTKNFILVPFERSIVKIKNNDNKIDRYFSIAKEAAELSHRESIPNISFIENIKKIDWNSFDNVILADEEEQLNDIKSLVNDKFLSGKIAIIIGPEGGISNNERSYLKSINSHSITLGKYIFPAEIACLGLLTELKR